MKKKLTAVIALAILASGMTAAPASASVKDTHRIVCHNGRLSLVKVNTAEFRRHQIHRLMGRDKISGIDGRAYFIVTRCGRR